MGLPTSPGAASHDASSYLAIPTAQGDLSDCFTSQVLGSWAQVGEMADLNTCGSGRSPVRWLCLPITVC